jgi:AcrR family transcriptional regulator
MGRGVTDFKRQYDGAARRAQAERVRAALIEAARDLVLGEGYAALTIPKVAVACGVSAESVYKRFRGKPGLLRAVVEQALRGVGPVAAENRSDALSAEDLPELLRGWGRLASEVRVAAEHDPELADLARELDDTRRARMAANARRLDEGGHLPPGLTLGRVTDILWTYSSPEVYDLLVVRSGWNLGQYATFITDGLAAHLGT